MKLSHKLLILPVATAFMLIVLSGVSYWGMKNQSLAIDNISRVVLDYVQEANAIDKLMFRLNANVYKAFNFAYINESDKIAGQIKLIYADYDEMQKRSEAMRKSAETGALASNNRSSDKASTTISVLTNLTATIQEYKKILDQVLSAVKEGNLGIGLYLISEGVGAKYLAEISSDIEKLTVWANKQSETSFAKALASYKISMRIFAAVAIFAIVISMFVSFLLNRSITGAITRASKSLNDSAELMSVSSNEIKCTSQSLAEGASEQAASIEETSSALEEMSSMTKKNADNAFEANQLTKESIAVVERANESLRQVTTSMEEISKASKETSKIVKTIDDIAFQTNLLALNAAVEAARAGEAGAGFAVVADEVRNLAMRAADAAKNTGRLIEGTVNKINDGAKLVSVSNENFADVSKCTTKVSELVSEIAAASSEQAQGIEQINKAVVQVDQVTQRTAASAGESANASEEMFEQAELVKDNVHDLMKLVRGTDGRNGFKDGTGNGKGSILGLFNKKTAPAAVQSQALVSDRQKTGRPAPAIRSSQIKQKEISPEEIIPLEGDDFKDF
ncbi:MAG: MCP four helix bundle domain-containing protein [Deltaproteobacteria bacterium]|nr:MCP four helix bundle domain-containing protein [Deltaproteobacteria bacterium]